MIKHTFETKDTIFKKVGFYIALGGVIIFLVLIITSHYFAWKNGYDWKEWELSELVLYGKTAKVLFIVGTIINGICLTGILIPIGEYFKEKKVRISYYFIATIAIVSLILVGGVPEDWFPIAHYFVGLIFFLINGILVLFSAIYFNGKSKTMAKFYPIFGLITFCSLIFHISTRWFFGMAYTQRLTILLLLIYLLLIGSQLLLNKGDVNLSQNVP